MNRTALCIQMLELLNSHRKISITELASYLETNPRNIIEYKKELETAGYYIKSTTGKFGGYELENKCTIPSIKLNEKEKQAIASGVEYLRARNDYINKKDFELAISKLTNTTRISSVKEVSVYNHFPLSMSIKEIEDRFNLIDNCVENKCQLEIYYNSLQNKNKKHTIHPYKLFLYNNSWFVLAFDEEKGKVIYFKLNRIISLTPQSKTFRMPLYYKESNYLDEFGLKNNGDWFNVELEIYGKSIQLIKERVYGKNQQIIDIDNDKCLLKVKMQNKEDIVSFIFGLKQDCKVIRPKWLIEEIRHLLLQIGHLYGGDG